MSPKDKIVLRYILEKHKSNRRFFQLIPYSIQIQCSFILVANKSAVVGVA